MRRLPRAATASLVLAWASTFALSGTAQELALDPLTNGSLLYYGNYCGLGQRPGTPPVDELDAACGRHDACTPTGGLPRCACNDDLLGTASRIAADPQTPPEEQAAAATTAAAVPLIACH